MLFILQKYKYLVNLLGLDLLNDRKFQFTGVCFLIMSALVITMSLGNLLLNTEVNEETTNSIIASLACLMAFIYTAHMLINRVRFSAMEDELQHIVNESECELNTWQPASNCQ